MADIFISYARVDRPHVAALVEALKKNGLSVWWDSQIETGARFDESIQRELDAAQAVVVVWSPHSIASSWVKDEAGYALQHGKLVSASLSRTAPPIEFDHLHTYYLNDQYGRFRDEPMSSLIAELREYAERRSGPPLLDHPRIWSSTKALLIDRRYLFPQTTLHLGKALALLAVISTIGMGIALQLGSPPLLPPGFVTENSRSALRSAQSGQSICGNRKLRFYRSSSPDACRLDCEKDFECQGYTWFAKDINYEDSPSMCCQVVDTKTVEAKLGAVSAARKPIPGLP